MNKANGTTGYLFVMLSAAKHLSDASFRTVQIWGPSCVGMTKQNISNKALRHFTTAVMEFDRGT